jgi:hypothetical protein
MDAAAEGKRPVDSVVAYVVPILQSLKSDIEKGLLAEVVDGIRGEGFDKLLDHAEEYHRKVSKEGSGVLTSAIFEDAVRRIAERNVVQREKLDQVIDALRLAGVLSPVKANRCEAAAGLRNKALHAK